MKGTISPIVGVTNTILIIATQDKNIHAMLRFLNIADITIPIIVNPIIGII